MNMIAKRILKITLLGLAVGGLLGYFFGLKLPLETASELIQTLASISAISGSLVGWSSNWIAQSRSIIRDIDNNTADDLFHQLGDFQKELIWRWGMLYFFSILAITFAVIVKKPELSEKLFFLLLTFSFGFLGMTVIFVFFLFQGMLAVVGLKSKLDDHEREQARKERLLRKIKKEETTNE